MIQIPLPPKYIDDAHLIISRSLIEHSISWYQLATLTDDASAGQRFLYRSILCKGLLARLKEGQVEGLSNDEIMEVFLTWIEDKITLSLSRKANGESSQNNFEDEILVYRTFKDNASKTLNTSHG